GAARTMCRSRSRRTRRRPLISALTLSQPENVIASLEVPPDVRAELLRVQPRLNRLARRVYWLETAGSTNDIAARLAEVGGEEGTVVVAEAQTAGRGRMGRVWHSPAGAGLYVSIILKPAFPTALLTLGIGVALAEGVQAATGLPAEIKWPNDR